MWQIIGKKTVAAWGSFFGIIAFLLLYGLTPLDVTNDHWIMAGYDETDIIQHYAGWVMYRNSPWTFPLGMSEMMAAGTGTMLSFTDSVPWAAILFKCFDRFLPSTFQYFGIYTLLCYILQGAAAALLLRRKTADAAFISLGTLLFVFAPILMDRAMRHTALGSQWLVLLAIYFFLEFRQSDKTWLPKGYFLLTALLIGLHPYFLPMVMVFVLLTVIEAWQGRKISRARILGWFLAHGVLVLFCCYILGIIGQGVNSSRDRFGYFSMNIDALFNPLSVGGYYGGYLWSSFLPAQPLILGNGDGFNYLGLGGILLAAVVLLLLLRSPHNLRMLIRQNRAYLICMAGLTLFAISNVITFRDQILLQIPLNQKLQEICGTFRASSRMFYPVYYSSFIFSLYYLWDCFAHQQRKFLLGVLLGIVVLQGLDLSPGIAAKEQQMQEKSTFMSSVVYDEALAAALKDTDCLVRQDAMPQDRELAVLAGKCHWRTSFSVANSGSYVRAEELGHEQIAAMEQGRADKSIVLVLNQSEKVQQLLEKNPALQIIESRGLYFVRE